MLSAFIPITAIFRAPATPRTDNENNSQEHADVKQPDTTTVKKSPPISQEETITDEDVASKNDMIDNKITFVESTTFTTSVDQKTQTITTYDNQLNEAITLEEEEEDQIVVASESEIKEEEKEVTVVIENEKEHTTDDIITVLTHEHDKVKQLYDSYRCECTLEEKAKIRNYIVKEILKQDTCQQSITYAHLKEMPFSEERLNQYLELHQDIRNMLHDIQSTNMAQDPEFDQKMEYTMAKTIMYMDLEDLSLMDFLKKNLSEQELQEIGQEYTQATKQVTGASMSKSFEKEQNKPSP